MIKKYHLLLLFALLLNATSPLAYANAPLKEDSDAELSSQSPAKGSSVEESNDEKVLSIVNDEPRISEQVIPESDIGDHLTERQNTSEQEKVEGQKNKMEYSGGSSTELRTFHLMQAYLTFQELLNLV